MVKLLVNLSIKIEWSWLSCSRGTFSTSCFCCWCDEVDAAADVADDDDGVDDDDGGGGGGDGGGGDDNDNDDEKRKINKQKYLVFDLKDDSLFQTATCSQLRIPRIYQNRDNIWNLFSCTRSKMTFKA